MPSQLPPAPFELELVFSLVFMCWVSTLTYRKMLLLLYGRLRWGFFWRPYLELAVGVAILSYGSYYANAPFFFGCSVTSLGLYALLRQLRLTRDLP